MKKITKGLTALESFNYIIRRTDLPFPIVINENGKYINEMNNYLFDFESVEMLMFDKITVALNSGELSKEKFNQLEESKVQ